MLTFMSKTGLFNSCSPIRTYEHFISLSVVISEGVSIDRKMKLIQRLAILECLLALLIYIYAEEIDPCEHNEHFTDPKYTCCAKTRYNSPGIYTDAGLSNKCLNVASNKIVHSLWSYYRCLWEAKLGKDTEISFDTIREELGKNLPAKVQADIKSYMEDLKDSSKYNFEPFAGKASLEPFTTLATAWNAYYTAENWACNKESKKRSLIKWEQESPCLSWIQQSFKRGGCCNNLPIPLEFFSESYLGMDKLDLLNYTATTFMTLTGNYKFQNVTLVSRSATNAACRRAALLVKQNVLNMDSVKTWITSLGYNTFQTTVELLIPKYLSSFSESFVSRAKKSAGLETNEDMRILSNFSINEKNSQYFYFMREWKKDDKFDFNGTRSLLWHCHVVQLAVTSYKNLNVADMCL